MRGGARRLCLFTDTLQVFRDREGHDLIGESGTWWRGGLTSQTIERLLGQSCARRIRIGLEQHLVRRTRRFGRTERLLCLAALVVCLGYPHRAWELLNRRRV